MWLRIFAVCTNVCIYVASKNKIVNSQKKKYFVREQCQPVSFFHEIVKKIYRELC